MNQDDKPPKKNIPKKSKSDEDSDGPILRKKPRNDSLEETNESADNSNANSIVIDISTISREEGETDVLRQQSDLDQPSLPAQVDPEIIDHDVDRNSNHSDMIEIDRCLKEFFGSDRNKSKESARTSTNNLRLAYSIHVRGKKRSGVIINAEELIDLEEAFSRVVEDDDHNSDTAISIEDANSDAPDNDEEEIESPQSSEDEEEEVKPVRTRKRKH